MCTHRAGMAVADELHMIVGCPALKISAINKAALILQQNTALFSPNINTKVSFICAT